MINEVSCVVAQCDECPNLIENDDDTAESFGWWSGGDSLGDKVLLCDTCRDDPKTHTYVEPETGPRYITDCQVCGQTPGEHPDDAPLPRPPGKPGSTGGATDATVDRADGGDSR